MDTNAAAKRIEILEMIDGWPSAAATISRESVDAYCDVVADHSVEAVRLAAKRIKSGLVDGLNMDFLPTAPRLAEQVRLFDASIAYRDGIAKDEAKLVMYRAGEKPPEGYAALGPLEADFGSGKINLRDLLPSEKLAVEAMKGIAPDGRSMRGWSAEQIRGALAQDKADQVEGPKKFAVPGLGRM